MRPFFVVILFFLSGCSGSSFKPGSDSLSKNKQGKKHLLPAVDTGYVRTGFYFITTDTDGMKMRLRGTNQVYIIALDPFASVKNTASVKIQRSPANNSAGYFNLCLTFDAKGTNDLKEGTGNLLHPKIAVVVANQLLYVVDNTAKITTGVMNIELINYTDAEIDKLKDFVEHER